MATIHSLGQYFTTNLVLKKKLVEMIKNEPDVILEPSIGRGDLIISVKEKFPQSSIDMYEIDNTIELLNGIDKCDVIYGDFLEQDIKKRYKTIIGNPTPDIMSTAHNQFPRRSHLARGFHDNSPLLFSIIEQST